MRSTSKWLVLTVAAAVTYTVAIVAKAVAQEAVPDTLDIGGVKPAQVVELFNANVILIMFVVGLIGRYAPGPISKIRAFIPWINTVWHLLATMLVAPAQAADIHAAGFSIGGLMGLAEVLAPSLGYSLTTAFWWDKFVKPGMKIAESAFGWGPKKPPAELNDK